MKLRNQKFTLWKTVKIDLSYWLHLHSQKFDQPIEYHCGDHHCISQGRRHWWLQGHSAELVGKFHVLGPGSGLTQPPLSAYIYTAILRPVLRHPNCLLACSAQTLTHPTGRAWGEPDCSPGTETRSLGWEGTTSRPSSASTEGSRSKLPGSYSSSHSSKAHLLWDLK